MFETVLVGTDGSDRANRAVDRAVRLVQGTDDHLHIVTAYRPPSLHRIEKVRAAAPEEVQWRLSVDSEAQAALHQAVGTARACGVVCDTSAEQGDPATVILETAQRIGAQLIVVGSKGVERRILGSVPHSVSQQAECDVLIVHTN
ncbi:MAG: universal stress protein [Acidimicrobiales bacterium]